jgi:cation transport regulator ChaC
MQYINREKQNAKAEGAFGRFCALTARDFGTWNPPGRLVTLAHCHGII